MDSKSLKIGNYIKWKNEDIIEIINVISEKAIGLESDIPTDMLTPLTFFESIPLTEDWLINFGLNEPKGIHNDIFSGLINTEILSNRCIFFIGNIEIVYVDYVHQLQNLFFCLTGKELTL